MKCPHCNTVINNVELKSMDVNENFRKKFNWVAYVCPNVNCSSILWVSIDPVAIANDIISKKPILS